MATGRSATPSRAGQEPSPAPERPVIDLEAPAKINLGLRVVGVRPGWSYAMSVVMILSFSGFYEVMEGVVAIIVSPELGTAYRGTQGDEWDAQKDTFFAFAGSIGAMLITWRMMRVRSV